MTKKKSLQVILDVIAILVGIFGFFCKMNNHSYSSWIVLLIIGIGVILSYIITNYI